MASMSGVIHKGDLSAKNLRSMELPKRKKRLPEDRLWILPEWLGKVPMKHFYVFLLQQTSLLRDSSSMMMSSLHH